MALPSNADVVIIGSGFAGLSAGVRLAEGGHRVVVVEEAPRMGGRATSFVDRQSGERVDNGQHALFGCYRCTYDFLRRINAAHLAPLQRRLTLTMADGRGRMATLTCPSLPPPWHLLAGVLRWKAISIADRLRVSRLRPLLQSVARDGAAGVAERVAPDLTVSDWLTLQGQPPALCDWLWYPLALASLNQQPDVAAAAPFVRVLAELFAPDPEASAIGLPIVPLDDLFAAPAAEFIRVRGGAVIVKSSARVLATADAVTGVRVGESIVQAPVVVSAVPWHAFGRLWDAAPPQRLAAIAADAAATSGAPIVTVNLWLDAVSGVMPAPFVGLVAGPMHWVFDKGHLVGRLSQRLSVVASGADHLLRLDNERITGLALEQLRQALPGLVACPLRRSVVVREPRATFSLAPGGRPRPRASTPLTGFYLAGDWTDTGLPGTIEGAVASGYAAATAILHNQSRDLRHRPLR